MKFGVRGLGLGFSCVSSAFLRVVFLGFGFGVSLVKSFGVRENG